MEALLDNLYSENYTLNKPLVVKLKKDYGEYVAQLQDINVGATGVDIEEALMNLSEIILNRFKNLNKLVDKKLGSDIKAQKVFLNSVIIRKE
jgi:hypothetical protein